MAYSPYGRRKNHRKKNKKEYDIPLNLSGKLYVISDCKNKKVEIKFIYELEPEQIEAIRNRENKSKIGENK